jgi:hypothetical protein
LTLFSQIHEIVFHGNGGYDWETVYNMPVWLRTFTFNKLKEYYEKQNEENEKVNNQLQNKANKNIAKPNINQTPPPTYKVKAPKK